ncbi:MAG: glycosyl hydrolase [Verrucomicrobia bacterium]|nr:glycosyl hydrolase [Verrucomicrobiota bacterium]
MTALFQNCFIGRCPLECRWISRWLLAILATLLGSPLAAAESGLAAGFREPPAAARPWVYWFWLNGNLTREGITADLEAMQRVGIGGVLIMEVDQGTPVGPVAFMSDEWRALFKHMVTEAQRLGLEVSMNNDAGWNGSGGPWVPLDKAMQVVVTSETRVTAGNKFDGVLPQPGANKGFYREIAVLAFPTPKVLPNTADRVNNLPAKAVAWSYISGYSTGTDREVKVPAEVMIEPARIVDLTDRMGADGRLVWEAPALVPDAAARAREGDWTVVRFGHTFSGAESHPAPATGIGPECDKLSKEGIEVHFNGMLGKLIEDAGPLAGKALVATHVDSWEIGGQNWTPKMREEFKRLRGYDMLPFMPILTGRFIGSVDTTERFLWDLRQTVSELLAENYIGQLGKLAHAHGLRLSMEAYGTPALDMDVINQVDEPVCEFWWSGGGRLDWTLKAMASAAHVNGRPIVGAEAFTSNRRERWRGHPANLKARGDRVFCGGVNRFIIHRYAMQPWTQDRRPGMSMGPYGLHYERTQTWWEDSQAWHQYLARCQYLLRQGTFVAEVLSLQPEEPMQRFNLLALTGYDYDGISPQAFLSQVTVKDGRLTVPSGMQYRLLALSTTNTEHMTVPMLRKIKGLVEDGAVILGEAPAATPGLADYPQADQELKQLAAELWGTDPTVNEHALGKGRVFRGMKPEAVLTKMEVVPDFIADQKVHWIHRTVDGAEVYYLASCVEQPVYATGTFRVSGRQPELWDPEAGTISHIPGYWAAANGCTAVPLRFAPSGAMFVVFRDHADPTRQIVSVTRNGTPIHEVAQTPAAATAGTAVMDLVKGTVSQAGAYEILTADGRRRRFEIGSLPEPLEIGGPWEVSFPPHWGAPANVTLDKLVEWSQHPDPGVKYFSGTATYSKKFDLPQAMSGKHRRVCLDLGSVAVMARVWLNGKDLGMLWKAPFRVEVAEALKSGENELRVSVVNLWINRLIGDELLPDDCERNPDGSLRTWPAWLLEGKPSPSGRSTFGTWRLWNKHEALAESGLLGPVRILVSETMPERP